MFHVCGRVMRDDVLKRHTKAKHESAEKDDGDH